MNIIKVTFSMLNFLAKVSMVVIAVPFFIATLSVRRHLGLYSSSR